MTAPDPRLEEIEGRANVIRRCMEAHPNDSYDMGDIGPALEAAKGDVTYLLAELRKAQDGLAAVSRIVNQPDWEGFPPFRVDAEPIRAAVADATGGGE